MPCQLVATLRTQMRQTLSVLALLAATGLPAIAQYRFDHWTTEHGLPQNSVNAVLQTSDGYLWLATNDGLARFDGMRFKVFDRGNTAELGSNRFTSLYEDRAGTLWIGSFEGYLVSYSKGKFATYTTQHGLPYDEIHWIEEDTQGHLWLTGDKSFTRWHQGRGSTYDPAVCLPSFKRDPDRRGRIWWSVDQTGLHLFTGGRLHTYTKQDGLPSLNIKTIHPDRCGNLWIGTFDAGTVTLKDGRLTSYSSDKVRWPDERSHNINYEDQGGNLWLFPEGHTLAQLSEGRLTRYDSVKTPGGPFYEDREGTLWLGSYLGLFRTYPTLIRTLTDEVIRRALPTFNEWVYCILEDREGTVWLGKLGGGVARYRDGQFTHHVGGKEWEATLAGLKKSASANVFFEAGLFNARVTSLYEDRAGIIWIGTDAGMSRFKDGQFTRFTNEHGLANVWAMHEDHAGNFWFGTATGLTRLRDGAFTSYTTRDGLAHDDVKAIYEDRAGALWLGTHGGLTRYARGRFTTFAEFGEHQVRNLYEDADGVLWIGTYGSGLFRFKDGKFFRFTTNEGLFNNGVFQILEDARGYFWLSCNKGIYRVRRQELNEVAAGRSRLVTAIPYGKDDGMRDVECNGGRQPAGWKLRNGQFWFPTQEGIAIIDPAAVKPNPLPPPVAIEECRLEQTEVPFSDGVRVPPGKGQLEIRYTGLSFIQAEQVRFRYKLEGLDSDWIEAGNRRVAYYNQLPFKPYTATYNFIIQAANSDGVWNEQGARLRIIVVPSFWQTWWFAGLCLLSAIGGVLFVYRRHHQRRIRQLEKEKAAQQAFAHQLIEAQEQERQRIAANLHDSLSQDLMLIRNWALQGSGLLTAQAPGHQQLDDIAERSAHAIGETKEIIYNLRPLLLEQIGLAGAIKIMFRKLSSSSGIAFSADLAEFEDTLPLGTQINLYRIVQECANNVVKHSGATQTQLAIKQVGTQLSLVLHDNGRGFDVTADARGLGLTSLTERAHMLGGRLEIESRPGAGTTITLVITLLEADHAR